MTDWTAFVRRHLPHAVDDPAREADIVEELAQHLAQREADLIAGGAEAEAARRHVLDELPEWRRLADEIRHADRPRPTAPAPPPRRAASPFSGLWRDLRYAVRTLRRAPGYAVGVSLILAVALGAATATFSVVNGVLLRPLPYDAPDRLVRIYDRSGPRTSGYIDGPTLSAIRQSAQAFEAVGGVYTYRETGADLRGLGATRRVAVYSVTAGYFEALGARPIAGRSFERSDERPDAGIAMISERLAVELCGRAAACIGRPVRLDDVPAGIVGVVPGRFRDPIGNTVDVWTPHVTSTSVHNHYISVVGRLAPDVSVARANQALERVVVALNDERKGAYEDGRAVAVPLHEDRVGPLRTSLLVLLGAVGLVLLIACVNVSHLVLARGLARERELAIRAAIGCGRWPLVRQALAEQVVLGLTGGAAGALLAWALVRAVVALAPGAIVRPETIVVDRAVFLFGATAALSAALLAGLPAVARVVRGDLERPLRAGARGTTTGRRRIASAALVSAQVALSVVVLSAAVLLVRTFTRLASVDLGFRDAGVLTFEVNLPAARYADGVARARVRQQLTERFDQVPGVIASGRVSRLPVSGEFNVWGVRVHGRATGSPEEWIMANVRVVDGRYFDALGIPLVRGRLFDRDDRADRPGAIVVSEALVRRDFPGEDSIGQRLRVGGADWDVVGIVRDVRHDHRVAPEPTLYLPHAQFAGDRNWQLTEVIRLDASRKDVLPALRQAVATLDPELVLHRVRPLEDVVGDDLAAPRFSSALMTGYAVLGLLLAALGLAGVLAYAVSERTPEIGIRMALGATRAEVRRMVIGSGLRWVALGLAFGLPAAAGTWRLLGTLVADVDPLSTGTLGVAAAVMLAAAVVAASVPAHRATRVEPLRALRTE